jgi:diguanylate cyclase (GGDEF)-like protein
VSSRDENSCQPASTRRFARTHFPGKKILVVDDDKPNISLIRMGLAAGGYEFAEAYDGASALARIRDAKPDLVIMDVEMPGLSGVEVCRIIKANQGDGAFGFIPVILMTARGSTGKVEGLELGADDYLTKPFDMLELSARVQSMLRLKALQDELVAKCRDLDRMNQDLERKSLELERLARVDPLTGLFNRRYFEERFYSEFARSQRYRVPLTCLMLDIDHFKKVNDTRGHQGGDHALKEVALTMRRTLRDVDLLARFGGEEFVAVLPETAQREGERAAERLRAAVERNKMEHDGKPLRVTVSIGVASYPVPGINDPEALLRVADDALYRAKQRGRNRVEIPEE